MSDQCAFMAAAYPMLSGDDTCSGHRHEPRVFALARAMAQTFQRELTNERVAWFLDDADAIVDDFGGQERDHWTVEDLPNMAYDPGIDHRFRVNGVEYVVPASEWEPAVPVKRETWESWHDEYIDEDDS